MKNACNNDRSQSADPSVSAATLPLPEVPLLEGDSLDLAKLGTGMLETYVKYPGIQVGDEIWPRFYGCGETGEIYDYLTSGVTIDKLDAEGRFKVSLTNAMLINLSKGYAFYSYSKTVAKAPGAPHAEENSLRLFFYIDKVIEPALLLGPPHFVDSDDLVIDLVRVPGDGQVITASYPFMAVGDEVMLSWNDEFAYAEQFSRTLKAEDIGRPLVWRIDSSLLLMAGNWCELSYAIKYKGGSTSQSPIQRFQIESAGSGQTPTLPPPQIPGHSGELLDPNKYPAGLLVTVNYPSGQVVEQGDELLLTAAGKQVNRSTLRVDRSMLDSGRLHFLLPHAWLQSNVGEAVSLSWQWARQGYAFDSSPLPLVLRKPLDLKVPFIEGATKKDPADDEVVDPELVDFGFIYPDRIKTGAYAVVPAESETSDGKITMHWEGFGSTGKYQTSTPTVGDNLRFRIPSAAVPASFNRRVKVFYSVEDSEGNQQDSPAHGLRVELPSDESFEAVQCPEFPSATISLKKVGEQVSFFLSSRSWSFFDQGQRVRVVVTAKGNVEDEPLPDEVIRDDLPVTEDEWFDNSLRMDLSRSFLEKVELNSDFYVYVFVSFDEGDTFLQGRSAEFKLTA